MVRRLLWVLGSLLFLLVVITVLLLYPVVQTWIAHLLSERLSKDLGTTIRIDRVELRPFGPNRLHGVYIADLSGDTLIAAEELWVRGLRLNTAAHLIKVRRLELHGARFALAKAEGEVHSNLTTLLDKLSSGDTTSSGAEWRIQCGKVDIRRLHFSYHDANVAPLPFGVDFDHVDVPDARILGRELQVAGDSILFRFDSLALDERSGLRLRQLAGAARVCPRGIRIQGLELATGPQREGAIGTDLRGDLDLRTESFGDFSEFTTRVFLQADLDSSRLQFADVALFAPDLQGVDLPIGLSGSVRGTVNELKGRNMEIRFGERSVFRGDAELSGLPDVPNTFMVIDVRTFATDPEDLAGLPVPPFMGKGSLQLPVEVQRLGAVDFSGNFTGFINAFTTYGRASTAAGALRTDITYEKDTTSGVFELRGRLATEGFDLGRVVGTTAVGLIACDARVAAKGRDVGSLEAAIEGGVSRLDLAQFSIGGITLNGKLEKDLFNGELDCDDPKLKLHFDGLADLRGRWPVVDFTADVQRLDARALGLIGGTGYSDVVMQVRAQGELSPDSLQGAVLLQGVTYCQDSLDLAIGDVSLRAWHERGVPQLELRSDLADARVEGEFYPTRLPEAVQSVLFSVFPALEEQVSYEQEPQRFTFDATVKDAQPVLDLVVPGLKLDSGAHFTGSFDSRTFDLGLNAEIPRVAYGGLYGDSLTIAVDKTMEILSFSLQGARQMLKDSTYLNGVDLTGKAYQDEVELRAGWSGSKGDTKGELNVDAQVKGPRSLAIDLEPSTLFFNRGEWTNARTAHIQVDSTTIRVDTLEMTNAGQVVRLGGAVGYDPTYALSFDLLDVQLENLRPLYEGPAVKGQLSGDGRLFDLYRTPYLLSYLCIDSLAIEDHPVGDLRFAASYNDADDAIDLNGLLKRDTVQALQFAGKLAPGKEQELDVDLTLDHFDLRFLDPYLPSAISDLQGTVTGTIDVTGKLARPDIRGTALMEDAGLRVTYLNTFYSFTHRVTIEPDMFALDLVKLHDEEGHTATAVGTIIHHGLRDWNFDVSMTMDQMMVLDTDAGNNELYYGQAYATGDLSVSGYADNLEVVVDARTAAGTDIHFPLGASKDVGGISFVRFVAAGTIADSLEEEVDLSGVRLDMNVEVTPDARFELIFDPIVGDIMRGSGRGNIAMTVTPAGDFSMKGDVEITEGDYLFTLRNLVNKRFGVEPGGHITWYGDPFDATVNIDAVYRLRAGLYDVMPAALRTEAYKKRVPVEVLMHLSQKLMNPDIGFEVRLPTVDEGVRTQVNSALANADDLNKQVFSLIVLNRFLPTDAQNTSDLGAGSATTGTELLSNQLSNFLSGVSKDFDLGVNWRTGDAITQDEVEVAVSTQIFNDRLQLTSNVGVSYGSGGTQQGNNLIGDFSAEYMLTQDGKLRFKAFSQSNDRNLNQVDQAPTTQGAGLAYREEFDTFREFLVKFANVFRKKGNKKPVE